MSSHDPGEGFALLLERCKCQEGCKSVVIRIINPTIDDDGSIICTFPIFGIPSLVKSLAQHLDTVFREIGEGPEEP